MYEKNELNKLESGLNDNIHVHIIEISCINSNLIYLTEGASSAYKETLPFSDRKSRTVTIPSGRSRAPNNANKQSRIFFQPSRKRLPWWWARESRVSSERCAFVSLLRSCVMVCVWGCSWGLRSEVNLLSWIIRLSNTSCCSYWAAIDAHNLWNYDMIWQFIINLLLQTFE